MDSIKIVTVGDGAVGKTSLLISYTTNQFPHDYIPTVFDNYTANLMIDEKMYHLDLWDLAGQDDYAKFRPLSYPHTDMFAIVYSVVSRTSLNNIRSNWLPEITHHAPNVPFVLLGTKLDMDSKDPKISISETRAIVKGYEETFAGSVQCSALTTEGLKEAFDTLVLKALEWKKKQQRSRQCRCFLM